MINSALLKNLGVDSLLTIIPGLTEVIFEKGKFLTISKGDFLFKSGDSVNGLYIPIDQDLLLLSKKENFFLLKGRSLALKNLIKNEDLQYSVQAEQDTKVIFLEREIFFEHLNQFKELKLYLEHYTSFLAVRNFKKFCAHLEIPENDLKKIISNITFFEFHDSDDLNIKLKEKVVFVTSGELTVEVNSVFNKSNLILQEGSWFGTEAIAPPFEWSYRIIDTHKLKLLALDLSVIKKLNLSVEQLQKIEDEPCLKLNFQEDDQYLLDPLDGSLLGEEISDDEIRKLSSKLSFDLTSFSRCHGAFYSYGASLRNFSKIYDVEFNLANSNSTLKRHLPHLNLNSILEVLHDNHFVARAVKIGKDQDFLQLPFLFIHQFRLLMIFLENHQWYIGFDPNFGYFKIKKNDFFTLPDLEVIVADREFAKDKEQEDLNKYRDTAPELSSWAQAKTLFKARKNLWIKTLIVSVLVFLINIIPPFMSQEIVDEVLDVKDVTSLWTYGIGLLLCYLAIAGLSYYRARITSEFSYLFDFDYSAFFYQKLLKLKSNFFGDNRVGEVFARIQELSQIREFFSGGTIKVVIDLVTAVIYSFILLFYSWKIAIIPFAAIVVIAILQYFIKKHLREKYLDLFSVEKKTSSQLSEIINSISTVKAFMSEKNLLAKYEDNFLKTVELRRDLQLISSFMNLVISFFSHVVRVVAIWVGVLMIFKNELTMGELFSINMFISRVLGPLNALVEFLTNLEEVRVSLRKLDDVFGYDFSKDQLTTAMGAKIKGRIFVDRVSFKYQEDGPDILKDVSLTIYPKQVVAIVGESGCGKTTLANLLAGNISASKGKIYFDGVDVKHITSNSLKNQLGFIQQSNDLFAGSIESNVTYAHTYTNEALLNHALEVSHSHEFISRFPTGLKQFLAEGGMGLSGGQKQRLSIARTFYNNPKILILDEATSALDSESEAVLIDNLKKLAQGKTTILIAHRLSTIRHADVVFVMEDGRVVESGNHQGLVEKRGKYYELFKEQMR